MAAILVYPNKPASTGTTLSTALQQLTPQAGVDVIDFVADVASYIVIDASGADGGSISGLSKFLVPANTIYPIPVASHGTSIFVAGTAAGTGYFFGVACE